MKKNFTICGLLITLASLSQTPGSLDYSFGTDGKVVTSVSPGADMAYSVALQSNGKIVVSGFSANAVTGNDFLLMRYEQDGTLDTSFGTNGIVTTDLQTGSNDVAYGMAIQQDGMIVLGGYSDDGNMKKAALVRYTAEGMMDTNFGTNGMVLTSFENTSPGEIKVVKIHPLTGNIIVGGNSTVTDITAKPVIARYTPAGMLDTTFNTTGIRLIWLDALDQQFLMTIEDLEVVPNGQISAVGWQDFPQLPFSSNMWAARVNENGSMDTTFDADGKNDYNGTFNGNDRAFAMLLKPDNTFVVAGSTDLSGQSYAMTLFEIEPNGMLGSSANEEAVIFSALETSFPYALLADPSGKYVMVGSTGTDNTRSFALVSINSNYVIDDSFDNDGKVETTFDNPMNEAYDAVLQPDTKIIAVGYSGNDIAIARYIGANGLSVAEQSVNNINVYPNPASAELKISGDREFNNETYAVTDINGRTIQRGMLTGNSINVDDLNTGMYFLTFDKLNTTVKFLKQ